jgi:hypothetical protein
MMASPVTVIKGWLAFAEQAPLFNALDAAEPCLRSMPMAPKPCYTSSLGIRLTALAQDF